MKRSLLTKTMLLLCALITGSGSVWADTSTLTFTAACEGSGTADDGVAWTVTSDGSESNYDSTKGIHYGTSSGQVGYIQLSTSDISGTITKIVVNASTASGVSATVSVTIDGDAYGGDAQSLTSSAADYTFTGSASGDIVVRVEKPSKAAKALYVKSIAVTYTSSGGGGSDPSISLSSNTINAPEAGASDNITVTYNNIASVDAEVKFYEADGTTAATYDWLDAEINASDNTKLDYVIDANTGAARTAYMKVHQKNTEVYSGLITVSQAKKTVDSPEYNLEGNKSYWQGTEITMTSAGNTIYYTMTTDGKDPATPTSSSTPYSAPIALGTGTTKIWAIAYDTYGNKSSVAKRTYTGVAPATLPFNWDEKATSTTGVISSGLSNYNSSPYLKFDDTDDYLIFLNSAAF